jgi:D-alanyl-D-alanine carboxypeptidase
MDVSLLKSRFFPLLVSCLCITLMLAPDADAKKHVRVRKKQQITTASGVNDPRYADIVMNPVTGEVYRQQEADEKRYPASLTKMMTLYMLFDALDKRKTNLDARMDISSYAATMPQTNLALTPGDSINVETAIKALVVRSANDVAVVVAETLGGDVENFAEMMTKKSRQLGMKNTVFKNPNGLPNSGQYTTARDMAKLGIALKRDFPRYYRYFSTLQFSHDGVTYYTHNRVMLRYAGVDGIKTGYIGASGFNLVTSVVRGGRPLVGVVMGGGSGGWRDNRMIQLLDDTYQVVASRGAAKGKRYPANLPLPRNRTGTGPVVGVGIDSAQLEGAESAELANVPQIVPEASDSEDGGVAENLPTATLPAEREAVRQETPFAAVEEPSAPNSPSLASVPAKPISKAPMIIGKASQSKVIELAPVITTTPAASSRTSSFDAVVNTPITPPETMVAQPPIRLQTTQSNIEADRSWGIQVGAFSSQALAVQAARTAMQVAPKPLVTAKMALADPVSANIPVHRARLENLSQLDARKACEVLISNNSPCFIYHTVAGGQ